MFECYPFEIKPLLEKWVSLPELVEVPNVGRSGSFNTKKRKNTLYNRLAIYIEADWKDQHQLTTRDKRMKQLSKKSPETELKVRGSLHDFALYVGYS